MVWRRGNIREVKSKSGRRRRRSRAKKRGGFGPFGRRGRGSVMPRESTFPVAFFPPKSDITHGQHNQEIQVKNDVQRELESNKEILPANPPSSPVPLPGAGQSQLNF
jgi:hypothetical protein